MRLCTRGTPSSFLHPACAHQILVATPEEMASIRVDKSMEARGVPKAFTSAAVESATARLIGSSCDSDAVRTGGATFRRRICTVPSEDPCTLAVFFCEEERREFHETGIGLSNHHLAEQAEMAKALLMTVDKRRRWRARLITRAFQRRELNWICLRKSGSASARTSQHMCRDTEVGHSSHLRH